MTTEKPKSPVFKASLPSESESLSEIAILAKGHWGYAQELLDLWRKDLQVEASYIEKHSVFSLWLGSKIIGFFAIVKGQPNMLDHLWILPPYIGKGHGKQAIAEIKAICKKHLISDLTIISDPNAEGFYLHHGAVRIGEHPSKPQNRMLPKLHLQID